MKNAADAEDAAQETFLRMIRKAPDLDTQQYERAWLIRTASNVCKDMLKHWYRSHEDIDDHTDIPGSGTPADRDLYDAVLGLPAKYKAVVFLYYYMGYDSPKIAEILKLPKSTVRNHLSEARAVLKERLGDDFYEE